MTDEELDIFDDNGTFRGRKPRSLVHRDGDWHRTFHCWIVGERAERRFVLFQLRGADKDLFPNRLDITAAGHLLAGETVEHGRRELEEELGVTVAPGRLRWLGCRTETVRSGALLNREFAETFMLRDDRALGGYRFERGEVAGLVELELDDALRLFAGEVEAVAATALTADGRAAGETARRVRRADVVPRRERYYLNVCIMGARLLDGERHLAI